ncbi:hypothetical protein [Curtobacterium sp. P97]|uniref:hypothetical protein n=1 Tax=Curtobacterium sp. P97 TaxID=2939562 RepID=UPI00203FCD12|nr:hypothetical protein [Curtobacterium sp. P97]MCM3521764.1 hypothetical protein [Curtobacterium sp. P97]
MTEWVSIREAAILAGRAPQNIYAWINKGKLTSRRNAQGQLEVNGIDVLRVESTVKPGRPRGTVTRRGMVVDKTRERRESS